MLCHLWEVWAWEEPCCSGATDSTEFDAFFDPEEVKPVPQIVGAPPQIFLLCK